MKKIIVFVLIAMMAMFVFVACNGNGDPTTVETTPVTGESSSTTEETSTKETTSSQTTTESTTSAPVECPNGGPCAANPCACVCPNGGPCKANPCACVCPNGGPCKANPCKCVCPNGGACAADPCKCVCPNNGACAANPCKCPPCATCDKFPCGCAFTLSTTGATALGRNTAHGALISRHFATGDWMYSIVLNDESYLKYFDGITPKPGYIWVIWIGGTPFQIELFHNGTEVQPMVLRANLSHAGWTGPNVGQQRVSTVQLRVYESNYRKVENFINHDFVTVNPPDVVEPPCLVCAQPESKCTCPCPLCTKNPCECPCVCGFPADQCRCPCPECDKFPCSCMGRALWESGAYEPVLPYKQRRLLLQ